MSTRSALEARFLYNVANAPLRSFPYPHIYVRDVFPQEVYAELQLNIPDPAAMIPIEQARPVRGYKERFVLDLADTGERLTAPQRSFWTGLQGLIMGGGLKAALLQKFGAEVQRRFAGQTVRFAEETLLVQDVTRYALGPHTDTPAKVVTVLFYLPRDDSQSHLGTSIYMPSDRAYRCAGGQHYNYEGFDRVATMPFLPNSMFAFVKTDQSFHGVEPVTDPDVRRWLLLYDIKGYPLEAAASST
jgi:hypothetical protein